MATVRFPDAEAMESVRSIACGDMVRGSGRSSWVKLKTRLSDGGIQVSPPVWRVVSTTVGLTDFFGAQLDPETEDRVDRASHRMSRGSHYRDSMRMSSRQSFVQLVSDLQGNKKPEGEAMRYATRRRSRSTTDSTLQTGTPVVRPPAAVLGALQELVAAICLHPEWEREEILQCLESACHGDPDWPQQPPPCIQRCESKSKVVFVDTAGEHGDAAESSAANCDETAKTGGD